MKFPIILAGYFVGLYLVYLGIAANLNILIRLLLGFIGLGLMAFLVKAASSEK